LVCFKAGEHIQYKFGVDDVLGVLVAFFIEAVGAFVVLLPTLALDNDALHLELVDLLLVQI